MVNTYVLFFKALRSHSHSHTHTAEHWHQPRTTRINVPGAVSYLRTLWHKAGTSCTSAAQPPYSDVYIFNNICRVSRFYTTAQYLSILVQTRTFPCGAGCGMMSAISRTCTLLWVLSKLWWIPESRVVRRDLGQLMRTEHLTQPWQLGEDICMYANAAEDNCIIWHYAALWGLCLFVCLFWFLLL